jgi:hypothetical protein
MAGRSAGSPVFWCSDGDVATLLIGADDESWDIAATIPLDLIEVIVTGTQ